VGHVSRGGGGGGGRNNAISTTQVEYGEYVIVVSWGK